MQYFRIKQNHNKAYRTAIFWRKAKIIYIL
jgi:hypothetical protein